MHSNPSREIILGEREIALFEAELLYLSYFGIPLPFTMLNLTYVQFDHSWDHERWRDLVTIKSYFAQLLVNIIQVSGGCSLDFLILSYEVGAIIIAT